MSAPDTNTDRQTAQHKAPLAGIALAALVAVGLILFLIAGQFTDPATPEGTTDGVTATDLQEGDVAVPDTAPSRELAPGDPDTNVTTDP